MWRRRRCRSVPFPGVLNQAPNVDDRTRETVTTVIKQLGFRRNSRARGLAAGRSFLLGVVQDDPNTHVISVFQRGIASLCAEEGYELVVHSSRSDERLVDRTAVKLTIAVTPDLHRALSDYAALYAQTCGTDEPVTELIPPMLAAFLDSDRNFARNRMKG